jgi:hypothetical protein
VVIDSDSDDDGKILLGHTNLIYCFTGPPMLEVTKFKNKKKYKFITFFFSIVPILNIYTFCLISLWVLVPQKSF